MKAAFYHGMKAYGGVEVWFNAFLAIGTRLRWVVSFTPQPLYHKGRSRLYQFIE